MNGHKLPRALRRTSRLFVAVLLVTALAALPVVPAAADPGPTALVGLTDAGVAPENGAVAPVISGDGSTVVFTSFGTDIDEGAPERSRLFARDRATSTTTAVDLPPAGATFDGHDNTAFYDVSADGRYVVFDIVDGSSNCVNRNARDCLDLYRRDLLTGTTELVSVSTDGITPGNHDSVDPSISADGQRVAFTSQATNLVGTPRAAIQNVYVRDFLTDTTELVSRSSAGEPGNNVSQQASISANGEAVAFYSSASNLDPSGPRANTLFLHHLDTDTTEAVVLSGQPFLEQQIQPALNADGTVVAFYTRSDLLETGASTAETRIYTIDLADDSIRTTPVHDFELETDPDISDDGRYVAYRADLPKAGGVAGVYVWDRETDATEVESVGSDGTAITTAPFQNFMSGDGRYVVFDTLESAYPNDEPDTTIDILVHDRAEPTETASGTGTASTASAGGPTYDHTLEATVSGSPGEVTITELESEDPAAPPIDGYMVLGQQVQITADPPTPPGFLTFTFDIDVSVIPRNAVPGDVDLFRDGAALPDCAGATAVGPCVASRTVLPSGDWRFVAHSPEASVWAVALDETPTETPTDLDPPTITLTRPVEGATYVVGQNVTASYECADADSGVATCTGTADDGAAIDTGSIGTKTFTVEASDNAGNTASRTVSYRVEWPVRGLYSPIDNPPILNTAKAGAIVPARFSLGGYRGTQVFASGYPMTQAVTCPGRARTDEIEQTLPASTATLTYRRGVYTYAWRSQKAWASRTTCRRLVLRFKDGHQLTAWFRLR